MINYHDEITKNSNSMQWGIEIMKDYINLHGTDSYIFLLDRDQTEIDEVYGVEKRGRIYLPPYAIKSLYIDMSWANILGFQGEFTEEQPITIGITFDEIVSTHRQLKNTTRAKLELRWTSTEPLSVQKTGSTFTLYKKGAVYETFTLTSQTLSEFAIILSSLPYLSCTYSGENTFAHLLPSFEQITMHRGDILPIYMYNDTYKNIPDIISEGDVFVTHDYRLHEITSITTTGNIAQNNTVMQLTGKQVSLSRIDLPGDFNKQIERKRFNLERIQRFNI